MEDFLRFAKHQLKTPLTLIKGYLSFMESGDFQKFPANKQKEIISKLVAASEKLNLLIDDIFLSLQAEEGLKINPEPIQIKELIENIYGKKESSLAIQGNAEISSDKFYLSVALRKLLNNAEKYSQAEQIDINIHKENNYAIIEIWEIWTDITGMGLNTAKKIIEILGGEISAESGSQNKGTKFIVKLPT